MSQPINPCIVLLLPGRQLHLTHSHVATVLDPQVDRPPAQCVEVKLKLELRAVGEHNVQLAVEPGSACERRLRKVEVARVDRLEGAAGANNLSRGGRE